MQSATEGVQDGENILGEFLFGAVIRVAENHDPTAVLFGKPLDKLESEPCKPVPVGNHNEELIAALKSLQYGDKSFSPEVEPAANVGDDFGVGVASLHEVNLSLQVVFLLAGTDPAVTHSFGRGTSWRVGVNVVETLACGVPVVRDVVLVGIGSQRVGMQSQILGGFPAGQINHNGRITG